MNIIGDIVPLKWLKKDWQKRKPCVDQQASWTNMLQELCTITLVNSVPFDVGHLGKAEAQPHIPSKREEWEFFGDKTTEEGIWHTGITPLWQAAQKQTELQMEEKEIGIIYKTDFSSGWGRRKKFLSMLTWEEGRAEESDWDTLSLCSQGKGKQGECPIC